MFYRSDSFPKIEFRIETGEDMVAFLEAAIELYRG
jgi:hypothetical protein